MSKSNPLLLDFLFSLVQYLFEEYLFMRKKDALSHKWKFARFGGVTQVMLTEGDDIANLRELDQKLWTVLAMPIKGIFFNEKTAELLDSDKDGFIRPLEILEAIDWICAQLKDPGLLTEEGDAVPLDAIKNEKLSLSAHWLLQQINKGSATEITLEDIYTQKKIFDENILSKKTEVSADEPDEQKLAKLLRKLILSFAANTTDNETIKQNVIDSFFAQVNDFVAWHTSLFENTLLPLELAETEKALAAFDAVKNKIQDYYLRSKLSEYQPGLSSVLIANAENLQSLATKELTDTNEDISILPIAALSSTRELPLQRGINPVWKNKMRTFYSDAVKPLLGDKEFLTEEEFNTIASKLSPYREWIAAKPASDVSCLSYQYLTELLSGAHADIIQTFIQNELITETERANLNDLEKLVLFRCYLYTLLNNYISFTNFYEGKGSVFQAGTLYFDSRSAHLCFELNGDARHASLDALSGAFLVYCDLSRQGGHTKKIIALFTNGDSDSIVVGRNGIFYDRDGKDWNATITKITVNPISVRQAFFMPYKKLITMIETQIAKRAADAEEKTAGKLSLTAEKVVTADKQENKDVPLVPKKLDLGTIALIGTAVGGVSALVSGILQVLFGLGYWIPLGLLGILLCISGPSMILAALKLRKRSIGSILEANGWAINAQTRINIPFGASLTALAELPKNKTLAPIDPFADKKTGRKIALLLFIIALAAAGFCFLYFYKKVNFLRVFTKQNQTIEADEKAGSAKPSPE
ncbi:hypothetical protein DWQ65_01435 [Treponema phagedenis]|nr:hypothetical protein [Treponema phagedenis]QEK01953.1 hypothetical protein FUT84_12800 [Treponema phagedenis]QEK02647.1 hypothetical protein FUT83_01720 [Treponema phagedenis]QEK07065.1 hypothetical protein FUT80_10280 [Treponema phagedenis]QEK08274.1 hypothetical protein FUT81_01700 [Treponema phagedenis]